MREGRYNRADDVFDLAANTYGIAATQPHLFREVPANLIWRTARLLRLTDGEGALRLLNTALGASTNKIRGKGASPERRALATRAELLEDRGRHAEAARDYHAAGKAYLATKPETAVRLLAKAATLDETVPEHLLWYGEALRLAASDEPPDVHVGRLTRPMVRWRAGFATGCSTPITHGHS